MLRLPRMCENRKFASFAHTFGLISPAFCVRKPEILFFAHIEPLFEVEFGYNK